MNKDLVATILDNECDPSNPYEIQLHCKQILVFWDKKCGGKWSENESRWIPGQYDYIIKVIG